MREARTWESRWVKQRASRRERWTLFGGTMLLWGSLSLIVGPECMAGCMAGLNRKPVSVLLISIDTLRADRVGCYGYENAETPNIDQIASEGAVFEDAESSAPITLPSHSSIFTGLYPFQHGVRDNGAYRLPENCVTLAEILSQRGFLTGPAIGGFAIASQFGIAQGFSSYNERPFRCHTVTRYPTPDRPILIPGTPSDRPAVAVTRAALNWASRIPPRQPFFLFVHYYDPHQPFEAPEPFSSRHAERPYDAEIAYVDSEIGRLLSGLRDSGLLSRTLVVITSDHGEALGEHGEVTHGYLLHTCVLRVPLIIQGPGISPGVLIKPLVRLIDIAPTVLDLLGLAASGPPMSGTSLRNLLAGKMDVERVCYAETLMGHLQRGWYPLRSIRSGQWRYIDAGSQELFDLSLDPQELKNVSGEQQEACSQCQRLLAGYPIDSDQNAAWSPGQDAIENLAGLGYLLSKKPPSDLRMSGPNPRDRMKALGFFFDAANAMRAGRFSEALPQFQKAIAEGPDDPDTIAYSALCALSLGDFELAERYARQALDLSNRSITPYQVLAQICEERGDWQGALSAYASGVSALGDDVFLMFAMAKCLRHLGQTDEAMALANRASAVTPVQMAYILEFAIFLIESNRPQEAITPLETVLSEEPESIGALYHMGLALMTMGRHRHASAFFQRVLRLDPEHVQAHNNMASCCVQLQNLPLAIWHYDRILAADPSFKAGRIGRACVLFEQGQTETAVAQLEQFLAERPDDPQILFNLSLCRERLGQVDQAILGYQRLNEILPPENPLAVQAREAVASLSLPPSSP